MTTPNYTLQGHDLQYIQVSLAPGESFMAEQGAMMYTDQSIAMRAVLGDGSRSSFGVIGRLFRAIKRRFTGESMFSSVYTNNGQTGSRSRDCRPQPRADCAESPTAHREAETAKAHRG